MKVLSQSGHCKSMCCIVGNLFQFVEDLSHLVQEGSRRLLNSVWEFPYRVAKDTCEL